MLILIKTIKIKLLDRASYFFASNPLRLLSFHFRKQCNLNIISIIIISDKMQESSDQKYDSNNYCKNHQDTPSGYFISDQPWIKYCKTCALNVALCGRKIEKQLTAQEYERKITIGSFVSALKKSVDHNDDNTVYYSKLTTLLEEAVEPLSDRIKDIEEALKELTSAKETLQKLYEQQIASRIKRYLENQRKIVMYSTEVKKQLQNIESNFGTLIQMENTTQFQTQKQKWNSLLLNQSKVVMSETDFMNTKTKIAEIMETFYDQLESISKFKVDIQFSLEEDSKMKSFNEVTFNNILTAVDPNSLQQNEKYKTQSSGENKGKGKLMLRSRRKMSTERNSGIFTKTSSKRQSFYGLQSSSEWQNTSKRLN